MLAGLHVVPQPQLTTAPPQVALAQSVSAERATPVMPRFDTAMAKAMTSTTQAILAGSSGEQADLVQQATAGPEALPLSRSDQLAGAERPAAPAVIVMRSADDTFGQVLVHAAISPLANSSAVPAFVGTAAPLPTEPSWLKVQASPAAATQSTGLAWSVAETAGASTPKLASLLPTVVAAQANTEPNFAPMAQVLNRAQASTPQLAAPSAGAVATLPVAARVSAVTANVMADATQVIRVVSQQGDPTRGPATSSTATVAPLPLTPAIPAFNGSAARGPATSSTATVAPLPLTPAIPAFNGSAARGPATSSTATVAPLPLTPAIPAFNGSAARGPATSSTVAVAPLPLTPAAPAFNGSAARGPATSSTETVAPLPLTPAAPAFNGSAARGPATSSTATEAPLPLTPAAPAFNGSAARGPATSSTATVAPLPLTPAAPAFNGSAARGPATSSTATVASLPLTPAVPAFSGTGAPPPTEPKVQPSFAAATQSTGLVCSVAETAGASTPKLASLLSTVAATTANTEPHFAPMAQVPNRAQASTTQLELPPAGAVAAVPVSARVNAVTATVMTDAAQVVRAISHQGNPNRGPATSSTAITPLPQTPIDPSETTNPSAGLTAEATAGTKGADQLNLAPVGQPSIRREVPGASAVAAPGAKDAAPTVIRQIAPFASPITAAPAPAPSTTVMPLQSRPLPSDSSAGTEPAARQAGTATPMVDAIGQPVLVPAASSAPTEPVDAPNVGHKLTPTMAHLLRNQNAAGDTSQAIEHDQARPIPVRLAAPVQVSTGLAANEMPQMAMPAHSPSTRTNGPMSTLPDVGKNNAPALGAASQTDLAATSVKQTAAAVEYSVPAAPAFGVTQSLPLLPVAAHDGPVPTPAFPQITAAARFSPSTDRQRLEQPTQSDASAAPVALTGPAPATPQIIIPQMIQPTPADAPTAYPQALQAATASVQPRNAGAGTTSESVRKTATDAQTLSAAPSPQEPMSTVLTDQMSIGDNARDAASAVETAQVPSRGGMPPPLHPANTTPPAAAASSSVASPSAASPAAQVAPALVAFARAPDGAPRLTLRLDPPELGHVQISIERPQDAPARVEITVQRQETLTLLLRDQPQLQTALNQAGVPQDGRSITFHLAAAEPTARPDAASVPNSGSNVAGNSGNGADSASRQGGDSRQQAAHTTDDTDMDFTPVALPSWQRAGLDITA